MAAFRVTYCENCGDAYLADEVGNQHPHSRTDGSHPFGIPWVATADGWMQTRMDGSTWHLVDGELVPVEHRILRAERTKCEHGHTVRHEAGIGCPFDGDAAAGSGRTQPKPKRSKRPVLIGVALVALVVGSVVVGSLLTSRDSSATTSTAALPATTATSTTEIPATTTTTTTISPAGHRFFGDLEEWEAVMFDSFGWVETTNALWQNGELGFTEARESFVFAQDDALIGALAATAPDSDLPRGLLADADLAYEVVLDMPTLIEEVIIGLDAPDAGEIRRASMVDLRAGFNAFAEGAIGARTSPLYSDTYACSDMLIASLILEAIGIDLAFGVELDQFLDSFEWTETAFGARVLLDDLTGLLESVSEMPLTPEAAGVVEDWRAILLLDVEIFDAINRGETDELERLFNRYLDAGSGLPDEMPSTWCSPSV